MKNITLINTLIKSSQSSGSVMVKTASLLVVSRALPEGAVSVATSCLGSWGTRLSYTCATPSIFPDPSLNDRRSGCPQKSAPAGFEQLSVEVALIRVNEIITDDGNRQEPEPGPFLLHKRNGEVGWGLPREKKEGGGRRREGGEEKERKIRRGTEREG